MENYFLSRRRKKKRRRNVVENENEGEIKKKKATMKKWNLVPVFGKSCALPKAIGKGWR